MTSKAWAQAEDAEKEVTKQTTRQISTAVVGRVTAAETVGEGAINAWSTSSYNWISIRSSAPSGLGVTPGTVVPSAPNFGVGLFQQILGADTHIDRFVLGGSGAFSYTSANQGGITSDNFTTGSTKLTGASFSFSPYAAFLLNRNVFFTGLLGYTRGLSWLSTGPSSLTEPGIPPFSGPMTSTNSSSTVDTFFTDVAVNGLYDVPDTPLTLGARLGWRYQYSWSHVDADTGFAGGGSSFGSNTYYAAVEARYAIEAFIPYVRVQYEYAQPLSNPGPNQNNNALFLLAGFDYRVSPTFTAGLHFMTQEDNPSIRNRQLALNMRLVF